MLQPHRVCQASTPAARLAPPPPVAKTLAVAMPAPTTERRDFHAMYPSVSSIERADRRFAARVSLPAIWLSAAVHGGALGWFAMTMEMRPAAAPANLMELTVSLPGRVAAMQAANPGQEPAIPVAPESLSAIPPAIDQPVQSLAADGFQVAGTPHETVPLDDTVAMAPPAVPATPLVTAPEVAALQPAAALRAREFPEAAPKSASAMPAAAKSEPPPSRAQAPAIQAAKPATPAPAPARTIAPRPTGRAAPTPTGDPAAAHTAMHAIGSEPIVVRSWSYLRPPAPPVYPPEALDRHLQGVVVVRALVKRAGRPDDVKLHVSSGFVLLDRAAIEAVRRYEFAPMANGAQAIVAWVEIPIRFQLR